VRQSRKAEVTEGTMSEDSSGNMNDVNDMGERIVYLSVADLGMLEN
jgi:hypothetical protein